jgi:signal transduction histidine kinase
VNDLLDVSRIEAGRVSLSLQPIDLNELADEVVADTVRRSQEENKPMNISVVADSQLPRVMADPERLRQIIDNLVDNAYNYTPAEGEIRIVLHASNGSVQVDVKDSGIGIPLEQQDRVFERFYRGEDPMVLATPGTGLGLPIVKQLVEMHRGKIWMSSKGVPGEGSTFSFTLPAYRSEE